MLNKANATLMHMSTNVKPETFMKTKPGRNRSIYQVSVETKLAEKLYSFISK